MSDLYDADDVPEPPVWLSADEAAAWRSGWESALDAVAPSIAGRAVEAEKERPDHDYCPWCGWWRERDDSNVDALREHCGHCSSAEFYEPWPCQTVQLIINRLTAWGAL